MSSKCFQSSKISKASGKLARHHLKPPTLRKSAEFSAESYEHLRCNLQCRSRSLSKRVVVKQTDRRDSIGANKKKELQANCAEHGPAIVFKAHSMLLEPITRIRKQSWCHEKLCLALFGSKRDQRRFCWHPFESVEKTKESASNVMQQVKSNSQEALHNEPIVLINFF